MGWLPKKEYEKQKARKNAFPKHATEKKEQARGSGFF